MKNMFLFLMVLAFTSCIDNSSPFSQFDEITIPVKLGEGSLSTDSIQWNNVFVSKTSELYYTKNENEGSVIKKFVLKDGEFLNNETINLPKDASHSDVYVNQEGTLMLFSSTMKEHESDTISDWNIWRSSRENGIWKTPELLFKDHLEGNKFYPWLTNSGNLYFSSTPQGSRNSDLFVSKYINGVYQQPKALPKYINSVNLEGDAFVSQDESYLIFAGFERGQNLGKSDLYITFNNNGSWTAPVWLGEEINSKGYDGSPFVTHDGKYLIFTSSRGSTDNNTFFNHYIVRFHPETYRKQSLTLENYLSNVGKTPTRFEVDNITTSEVEYGGSLSLSTNEIVFTRAADDFSSRNMMISQFSNGQFSVPQELKIGDIMYKGASDIQLSNDGEYLYFKMRGHIPNDSLRNDGNIWRSKRNGNTWSNAELLPETVNSELSEYYPMLTNSGNLYFSRELKDSSYDIFVSKLVDGAYQEAERLPDYINTNLLESDAYIAPDESYMIFVRMYAEGDLGVSDLYISFNDNGIWSEPKNMRSLNSSGVDGSPFVTSNGNYLIFTSTRDSDHPENFDGHLDIYIARFNPEDWK